MRIDNPTFAPGGWNTAVSSSYATTAPSLRNITKVTKNGFQEQLWIADGKLYCSKGGHGNISYTSVWSATDAPPNTYRRGVEQMWEVPFPPTETGTLVDADVFGLSAWALFDNGNLYTWGANTYGQLGLGNTTNTYVPTLSNTGVTRVYSHASNSHRNGAFTRLYILKAGELWGCGYNGFGQLADGTTVSKSSWTKITAAGTNPKSVWNLGSYTGCLFVQKSDNTIFACGYGSYGQLGLNNTTQTTSTLTDTGTRWNGGDTTMIIQDMQGGFGYNNGTSGVENVNITMFLDNGTTSRIASCGNNDWGTLGDATTTQRQIPVVPSGFSGRVQKIVRVGDVPGGVWVLRTDGTLWNWGYNAHGQLDRGTTNNDRSPLQVEAGIADIQESFMAGIVNGFQSNSPYIIKTDGTYWQCGQNDFGQVGDGTTTQRTSIVQMWFPNGTVIKHFGTNNSTTWGNVRFAVTTDNRIYAWGYNELHGIHEANTNNVHIPLSVAPPVLIK
jgi:alpha-tubulin suppressor-like RCC1 family protein